MPAWITWALAGGSFSFGLILSLTGFAITRSLAQLVADHKIQYGDNILDDNTLPFTAVARRATLKSGLFIILGIMLVFGSCGHMLESFIGFW
jgi:hypothetical protein